MSIIVAFDLRWADFQNKFCEQSGIPSDRGNTSHTFLLRFTPIVSVLIIVNGTYGVSEGGSFVPFTIICGCSTGNNMHANPSKVTILDLQRSVATDLSVATDDSSNAKSSSGDEPPALSDLDRALIEAAEEMSFDWPEFLPLERITEMALASLLFAGLVVLGRFLFLSFAS